MNFRSCLFALFVPFVIVFDLCWISVYFQSCVCAFYVLVVFAQWKQAGGRLDGLWRQVGGRLDGLWRQAGGTLEAGWMLRCFQSFKHCSVARDMSVRNHALADRLGNQVLVGSADIQIVSGTMQVRDTSTGGGWHEPCGTWTHLERGQSELDREDYKPGCA